MARRQDQNDEDGATGQNGTEPAPGTDAAREAALQKDPNEPGSDPNATAPLPRGSAPVREGAKAEDVAGNAQESIDNAQEAAAEAARRDLEDARARDARTLERQAAMRPWPSQEQADEALANRAGPGDGTLKAE